MCDRQSSGENKYGKQYIKFLRDRPGDYHYIINDPDGVCTAVSDPGINEADPVSEALSDLYAGKGCCFTGKSVCPEIS